MHSLKNPTCKRGSSQKTDIEGGDCLKRGLGQFADLRGAWQEKGGGVFDEGFIPQCTLWLWKSQNFPCLCQQLQKSQYFPLF